MIDADRQGVEAALGVGNGRQGLRRYSRRTGLGESEDGGEVEHWDWFREGPFHRGWDFHSTRSRPM